MNSFVFLASCLLALSGVLGTDVCFVDVGNECKQPASYGLPLKNCNALYGEYNHSTNNIARDIQAYANLHLERSYEYLLSASYFNNYQTQRKGFSKLFRKLSDDAWETTIDLIKHHTMRGGIMDFKTPSKKTERPNYAVEIYELESMAHALDTQKEFANRAFAIHREATRNSPKLHDTEIAHYIEEKFAEDHAKSIRDLAGYTSDLRSFIVSNQGHDMSIALYLFDEYLQKVV